MKNIDQLRADLDRLNQQLRKTARESYTANTTFKVHQKLFSVLKSCKGKAALFDNCSSWQNERTKTQRMLQELREQRKALISEIAKFSAHQSHSTDGPSRLLCV